MQQGDLLPFKMGNKYTVARALVEEIGLPNPDFFIKGDEVNYKHRAMAAGAGVVTVVDSRYIYPRPDTHKNRFWGKKCLLCEAAGNFYDEIQKMGHHQDAR